MHVLSNLYNETFCYSRLVEHHVIGPSLAKNINNGAALNKLQLLLLPAPPCIRNRKPMVQWPYVLASSAEVSTPPSLFDVA